MDTLVIGHGQHACAVCSSPLREPAFYSVATGSEVTCRECLYQPAFDADNVGISYAEWGDRWVESFPERQDERREMRQRAEELYPKRWGVGDVVRIPAAYGQVAYGQIAWMHPKGYRLVVGVQTPGVGDSQRVHMTEAPRFDLLLRTSDWALVHGIWTVVGGQRHEEVGDLQIVARDSDYNVFGVDPVTLARQSGVLDASRPTIPEWTSLGELALTLARGRENAPPYCRHLFTRSAVDAAQGAPLWHAPGDPMPGLRVAGDEDPQAQWRSPLEAGSLRVLPV